MLHLFLMIFFVITSQQVQAQFVCGSENVFAKNSDWMRNFAKQYGFASMLGTSEYQCGISGEDFRVCRKCQTSVTADQQKITTPMLSAVKYQNWIKRWKNERREMDVHISPGDFEIEKRMGHVRPGETKEKFEERNSDHWGESYLFMHRELFKMVQFELTLMGQPCITPMKELPKSWDDPEWPIPKGKSEQANLEKARANAKTLLDPKQLNNLSLNDLGGHLALLSDDLHRIYQDPPEVLARKCASVEAKTCDDLRSEEKGQANKHFWMIQSYLDQFVGEWMKIHGHERISKDCYNKTKCYQWAGTYTATYPY
jgi:hypothetical protein